MEPLTLRRKVMVPGIIGKLHLLLGFMIPIMKRTLVGSGSLSASMESPVARYERLIYILWPYNVIDHLPLECFIFFLLHKSQKLLSCFNFANFVAGLLS